MLPAARPGASPTGTVCTGIGVRGRGQQEEEEEAEKEEDEDKSVVRLTISVYYGCAR